MNSVPVSLPTSFGGSSLGLNNVPVSLPTSFGGSSLGLGNNALNNANTALTNALTSQALGLKIPTSLHIPTTLGLFNTSLSVANTPIPSTGMW